MNLTLHTLHVPCWWRRLLRALRIPICPTTRIVVDVPFQMHGSGVARVVVPEWDLHGTFDPATQQVAIHSPKVMAYDLIVSRTISNKVEQKKNT